MGETIATLRARIAALEAENARLRKLEALTKEGRHAFNDQNEAGKTIVDFLNCWLDQEKARAEIAERQLAEARRAMELRPMFEAPRDGTPVLLLTEDHGVVEARFSPGEWTDETPLSPREYSGAVWVCGDDAYQISVEELPGGHHDHPAIGWWPRAALAPAPSDAAGAGDGNG